MQAAAQDLPPGLRHGAESADRAGFRDWLSTHQICTIVLPTTSGATLRIRRASTPEPEHLEIYRLLGLPSEVMRPKKTWSEPAIATA